MLTAYINRIATGVPPHDIHRAFLRYAFTLLENDKRSAMLLQRMAERSGIEHRYSFLGPAPDGHRGPAFDIESFYVRGQFPDTAARMRLFEARAPELAAKTVEKLELGLDRNRVSHLLITCCTGFSAPGLDIEVIERCNLPRSIERTIIGFMGCYAAINALKSAHHIVRSEPEARVLVLNLELCSLHFQETTELEQVLSFLVFSDGCAASLVSAEATGLGIDSFLALSIPDSSQLITWRIGELGFDMHLSGQVPGQIGKALRQLDSQVTSGKDPLAIDLWAVHPGGRSILDAVEKGLGLPADALASSRSVLAKYGNMSSATVMFVLREILERAESGQNGCAMSFGPGLTAETMLFHAA